MGCIALLLAAITVLAAFYAVGRPQGDVALFVLAMILTGYSIRTGLQLQGNVLPSLFAMALTFGLTAILTTFAWKARGVLFDLSSPFAFGMTWDKIILTTLLPLALIAVTIPFVVRFFWPRAGLDKPA